MRNDAVDHFVREARSYCSFVENAVTLSLPERLQTARARLLGLYSAALSLPSVEPDDRDASPHPDVPAGWPGFDDMDIYWMMFDPYDQAAKEPVAGSLADDVLDVYRDIRTHSVGLVAATECDLGVALSLRRALGRSCGQCDSCTASCARITHAVSR